MSLLLFLFIASSVSHIPCNSTASLSLFSLLSCFLSPLLSAIIYFLSYLISYPHLFLLSSFFSILYPISTSFFYHLFSLLFSISTSFCYHLFSLYHISYLHLFLLSCKPIESVVSNCKSEHHPETPLKTPQSTTLMPG